MSLLPDPADIHAVARRISAHAEATRETAHRLERDTGATASSAWKGLAAERFALGATETAAALRGAAARLDSAAVALHRHACAVEHAEHGLRALAVRTGRELGEVVSSLTDDAGSAAAGVARLVGI